MPFKRGDSSFWWITYQPMTGETRRKSSKTTVYKDAVALERETRAQAWRERLMGIKPLRTFEQVARKYMKKAELVQRSFETTEYRMQTLTRFFKKRVMNKLTAQDIRDYIDQRQAEGVSASTINRELSALSAAITWCNTEYDWGLPNPVQGRKLKEKEGRVRWLNRAEVESLCRAARQQMYGHILEDFIRLAVNTGMRKEEMLGLEWRRVDMVNMLIHLEGEHTKADKRRSIPINQSAYDALQSRQRYRAEIAPAAPFVFIRETGERVKTLRTGFEKACRTAGIENFVIHDLRHTCAAWLVSSGVPLAEVRDLLGHSTITLTERYAHLAPARIRQAVLVLDDFEVEDEKRTSRFLHVEHPVHRIENDGTGLKAIKGGRSGG